MRIAQVINMVVIAGLALGLGFLSFFSTQKGALADVDEWTVNGAAATALPWNEALTVEELFTVTRFGRDSFSLFPQTEAMLSWDPQTRQLRVELLEGSIFFSSLAGDFSISVLSDFARVDSQNSVAYVSLNSMDQQLQVYAMQHPSLLSFTENGEDLSSLLVPSRTFVKVPESKVSSTLSRLRLAKLMKEFQSFSFTGQDLSPEVLSAYSSSQDAYEHYSLAYLSWLQEDSRFGPPLYGLGYPLYRAYELVQDSLTLFPHAERNLAWDRQSDQLAYAFTNLLYGDTAAGQYWLSQWTTVDLPEATLEDLYASLFFVLPGENLYPLKSELARLLYSRENTLSILRDAFREIENLLEEGAQVEAETAYGRYSEQFKEALQSGVLDDPSFLDDISREYQLLELLLRGSSVFYSVEHIQLLHDLEEKILTLAGSDEDLDEERQAFIQSKLRFLDNLFRFVIERKVAVAEGTALAQELIAELETYLNALQSEVAIRSYFESSLEEYMLSVQFMNSPEFYSYASFEDGLEDYRLKVLDLQALNAYLQALRSGEDLNSNVSLETAIEQVETDLYRAEIQYSEVTHLGDNANRLFAIEGARAVGYGFEANYDRETQLFYDVVLENTVRFSTGLSLSNIKEVFEGAVKAWQATGEESLNISEEISEESTASNFSPPSLTENVALARVEDALVAANLDPDLFTITLLDLEDSTFSLEAELADGLSFSAQYDLDTDLLTELVAVYEEKLLSVGDATLKELQTTLEAAIEAQSADSSPSESDS